MRTWMEIPSGGEAAGPHSGQINSLIEFLILALCAGCLVECSAKPPGKFQRIVIGPEVKEVQPWLLVQHVAMDGGHLDATCPQCLDDGIYLITDKNKIAGNGSLAAAGRLEI